MDEQQQHEEIRRGFNAGYMLEKLNPKLAKKLRDSIIDQQNPFLLGMIKGAEQYNQESFFDSPPTGLPNNLEDLDLEQLPDGPNRSKGQDREEEVER